MLLKLACNLKIGSESVGTFSIFSKRKEMWLFPAFTARVARVLSAAVRISLPS